MNRFEITPAPKYKDPYDQTFESLEMELKNQIK